MAKKAINPRTWWIESLGAVLSARGLEVASATLRRRDRQAEDCVSLGSRGAFIADGMGGYAYADVFAKACAQVGLNSLEEGSSAEEALACASHAAIALENHVVRCHGGASGLAVRFGHGQQIEWCSRGDVVIWALEDGETLRRLSNPDCIGSALTDHLANRSEPRGLSNGSIRLAARATIMVATDGIWRYSDMEALGSLISREYNNLEDCAVQVVRHAALRMTPDDASVILLRENACLPKAQTEGG